MTRKNLEMEANRKMTEKFLLLTAVIHNPIHLIRNHNQILPHLLMILLTVAVQRTPEIEKEEVVVEEEEVVVEEVGIVVEEDKAQVVPVITEREEEHLDLIPRLHLLLPLPLLILRILLPNHQIHHHQIHHLPPLPRTLPLLPIPPLHQHLQDLLPTGFWKKGVIMTKRITNHQKLSFLTLPTPRMRIRQQVQIKIMKRTKW
mmetsp:Transcript_2984/g.4200  ORF Transcript_2984/g.4200 Transcript_2984/m.4200 type:complete len:202 (-) Transcript_2984:780-1385(-)